MVILFDKLIEGEAERLKDDTVMLVMIKGLKISNNMIPVLRILFV